MLVRLRKSVLVACVLLLAVVLCSCGGGGGNRSTASTTNGIVLAWTPSHQDDTGRDWHEYEICGDIVKRAMALLPEYENVLCWETRKGLSSSNPQALKSECDQVAASHAQVFISVHVNSGDAQGFTARYYSGDTASGRYADALLESIGETMDMKYTKAYGTAELYVLNPKRNPAPIRVLLECGGNEIDRPWLSTESGRQKLAVAIVKAIRGATPSLDHSARADATPKRLFSSESHVLSSACPV
jgi:hypothetical protein